MPSYRPILQLTKVWGEICYNPLIKIHHVVPTWRMEGNYLMKLMRGSGLTRFYHRMIRILFWQRSFLIIPYFLKDL